MQPTTYSFTDIVGCFSHPLIGSITFGGELGVGEISISMETDHTSRKVAADGAVMVSFKPGDQGNISLKVQQTSDVHEKLNTWFNAVLSSVKLGNKLVFAQGVMTIRSILDGQSHTAIGISPGKQPEFTYGEEGQDWTWTLPAASITNE